MMISDLKRALTQLIWPNGMLVLVALVAIASGLVDHTIAQMADYAAVAVMAAGLMVAWRFHAMRSIAALLTIGGATLILRNLGSAIHIGSEAHLYFLAISLLLPLDLVSLMMIDEFTLSLEPIAYWTGFLALQAGLLAMTCRTGQTFWTWIEWRPSSWPPIQIPPIALIAFVIVATALLAKFARERKSLDAGLAWSLLPAFLALNAAAPLRTAFMAVAGIALTISVVETSYQLAYEDELTRLPGRRAFNQAIAALDEQYSIAMVDVDHFKKFNDTYGHDVGDQVLRMVASRLAHVSGDGRPFRCGGEEFAVVFRGKSAEQAMQHMELLRQTIEHSTFNVRGPERSKRRREERRYRHSPRHLHHQRIGKSVTVSIGLAQPRRAGDDVKWVMEAADKALYAAKERGRNRLVVATAGRKRSATA